MVFVAVEVKKYLDIAKFYQRNVWIFFYNTKLFMIYDL